MKETMKIMNGKESNHRVAPIFAAVGRISGRPV